MPAPACAGVAGQGQSLSSASVCPVPAGTLTGHRAAGVTLSEGLFPLGGRAGTGGCSWLWAAASHQGHFCPLPLGMVQLLPFLGDPSSSGASGQHKHRSNKGPSEQGQAVLSLVWRVSSSCHWSQHWDGSNSSSPISLSHFLFKQGFHGRSLGCGAEQPALARS